MKSFRLLHSHLKVLSINDLKRPGSEGGYERAFASLFDQDVQTFTSTMLLNLDQLEKQLDKEEFQEDRSMAAFWVINKQFQMLIDLQFTWDYDSQMTKKYSAKYTESNDHFVKMEIQQKQADNISTHTPEPSRHFNFTCDDDDDDEEYSIPLKDMPQISLSIALAPIVEDLIPIPRESEDTSGSDSESILPSSDDFSPIFEEKSVTFSNPLFDSNDFTSSDDESLSDEEVPEDVKIYSNSLFEFDDEYISSDVNPLFDEVLEDIECKDLMVSPTFGESTFLVTPLSDSNEDEFFTLRTTLSSTSPRSSISMFPSRGVLQRTPSKRMMII
ncbi:hypothetical protein Tco_0765352 [Tanacetum coccineum]